MEKRYRKMAKKANGKIMEIKDGQAILELPSGCPLFFFKNAQLTHSLQIASGSFN